MDEGVEEVGKRQTVLSLVDHWKALGVIINAMAASRKYGEERKALLCFFKDGWLLCGV